jgi:hypothetical protein
MSGVSDIHKDFPEFKTEASKFLEANSYRVFEETRGKIVYTNDDNIFVSIVNQRYDPPEIWIGLRPGYKNISLGWILECYLTGDFAMSKEHTIRVNNGESKNYCEYFLMLLDKYYSLLLEIINNQEVYQTWLNSNVNYFEKIALESMKKRPPT